MALLLSLIVQYPLVPARQYTVLIAWPLLLLTDTDPLRVKAPVLRPVPPTNPMPSMLSGRHT